MNKKLTVLNTVLAILIVFAIFTMGQISGLQLCEEIVEQSK